MPRCELASTIRHGNPYSNTLLAAFAAVGLIPAALGIYGVISYPVARRTHEFGIRMALGARPGDIVQLVLGAGTRLIAAAALLGLAGAFVTNRVLSSLLYGIRAGDPLTFVCRLILLPGIALLACYLASRRASRLDPGTVPRGE